VIGTHGNDCILIQPDTECVHCAVYCTAHVSKSPPNRTHQDDDCTFVWIYIGFIFNPALKKPLASNLWSPSMCVNGNRIESDWSILVKSHSIKCYRPNRTVLYYGGSTCIKITKPKIRSLIFSLLYTSLTPLPSQLSTLNATLRFEKHVLL